MSKNTANIARAISLLSDVLSRDAVAETEATEADPFDDDQQDELDALKHQSLEFGQQVADDLDTISEELDHTLEQAEFDDDDDNWDADDSDYLKIEDDEDEDTVVAGAADDEQSETPPATDADSEPSSTSSDDAEALQKTTAALEKSNEDLTEKVDDLTEALQRIDALIDDLNVAAKEFVSEVETI